jgi:glycosyltransferase involved in cell wall biosynthesis
MLYVITEKQRREYDTYFGKGKCKVLYKGADFSNGIALKDSSDDIVKFVYTGNIGAGRWKILAEIANQLRQINQHKLRAQLFIYTGTSISEKMRRSLDIPGCSSLMGSVPSNIIPKIQSEADVLVYTEPFEKQFRYKARLSFSTKIVDYLASSRCILAVGWRGCGGIDYLIKNDAAQVVTDISELGTKVQQLIESEQLRNQIAMRAYDCGKHNHQIEKIHEELYSDIVSVINNDK